MGHKNLVKAVLIFLTLTPLSSLSWFETGKSLLDKCESENNVNFGSCIGYVKGMADAHDTVVGSCGTEPAFCLPDEITTGELHTTVVESLKLDAEALSLAASGLVIKALYDAYPALRRDDGSFYCLEK